MNHCGVLRKITGFLERQECGYWCFSRPRATMAPAAASASITAWLASPFSPLSVMTLRPVEAGRVGGEDAVVVDREGDRRVDAARGEVAAAVHPDLEVLAAMAGRRVHEAGAGVVGDVVAVEQGDVEVVAPGRARGWAAVSDRKRLRRNIARGARRRSPSPASSRSRRAHRRGSAGRRPLPNCPPAPRSPRRGRRRCARNS